jgi:RND family efflux transporter MFP subunit
VSGYLTSIHFEEGAIVKEGDLLFVIDPRPYQAELGKSQADVAEAEAKVSESKAQLFQAEANHRAAQSRYELAKRQQDRADKLLPTKAISQDEYDVQVSATTQAEAQVQESVAQIESAKSAVITAQSAVETAKSAMEIAKLSLEYTRVYAPIPGRMGRHMVTQGNLVSGGSEQATLLTTIVSMDPIHCYFDADEQAYLKYTRLAREGKRASSREYRNPVFVALADESKGFPHSGHMDFVDNRMDQNTGTMRGRAILPNPDAQMIPGLFVRIRLPGSGKYEALLVPDYAVGTDQADKFVFVVEKGTARRQLVETGPIVHGLRVIRSGLTGGEQIVLRGLQRLRPGSPIVAKVEEIQASDDEGLPDDYELIPREKWLTPPPTVDQRSPAPSPPVTDAPSAQESP